MGSKYPAVLEDLRWACLQYRNQELTIDALKTAIWKAASAIVASDERELRDSLQKAEGELDVIQFTTGEHTSVARSLEVVSRLESLLTRWA